MTRNQLTFVLTSVACVAAGFLGHRALATVPVTADALNYTGRLTQNGAPLNATRTMQLKAYANQLDAAPTCVSAEGPVELKDGYFRISLDACRQRLVDNAGLWVEVTMDQQPVASRTKVGAVPYALEAATASGATGALDARIGTVERFRGFSAHVPAGTVPSSWNQLNASVVDFDTTNGYSAAQAAFIAPLTGYYRFSLHAYVLTGSPSADTRVAVWFRVNDLAPGPVIAGGGQLSNYDSPLPTVSSILHLNAQDKVDAMMWSLIDLQTSDGSPITFQGEYLGQ